MSYIKTVQFNRLVPVMLISLLSLFATMPVSQAEASAKTILNNFPVFAQTHHLSCEYAATRMITAFWDHEITENDFISLIPTNANPHLGFRGDIDDAFGGTSDYGIYAEPIAQVLESQGFNTRLIANGVDGLKQELDQGHPVQVWVIAGMGWGTPFQQTINGQTVTLVAGEHSMVVYGYDDNGVYVSDPGFGTQDYYDWNNFLRSWSYLGQMALAVWPAGQPDTTSVSGVSPLFYEYWLNNGGQSILGLPLQDATTSGSKTIQYFERARLEIDSSGGVVQAGLLGRELTAGRSQEAAFLPVSTPANPGQLFFSATGHTIGGEFQIYWQNNGGLQVFGYPISEEFTENGHTVQYFERSRFEFYPNNHTADRVVLGAVGTERMAWGS